MDCIGRQWSTLQGWYTCSCFLLVVFYQAGSNDSSLPINPATSALISGVVILGGTSLAFVLVALRLLRRSRHPTMTSSGVWNPTFKWIDHRSTLYTVHCMSACVSPLYPYVCVLFECKTRIVGARMLYTIYTHILYKLYTCSCLHISLLFIGIIKHKYCNIFLYILC